MTVRAKQTIHYDGGNGVTRTIGGGQEFGDDDPVVKDHPTWFETVSVDHVPADDDDDKKSTAKKAPARKAATKKDEDK